MTVLAMDEPDSVTGLNGSYAVLGEHPESGERGDAVRIRFSDHGATDEALLAIVKDRLECVLAGPNEITAGQKEALEHITVALTVLSSDEG